MTVGNRPGEIINMLQAVSIPLAAKICAAVVLTGGAGVVTYEIAEQDSEPTTVVAETTDERPDALAFDEGFVGEADDHHEASGMAEFKVELEEPADDETEGTGEKKQQEKEEADTKAPEIVILSPENESHHDEAKLVFEGETAPGAKVTAGPYPATVDGDGNWRIELILSPGANKATISAQDAAGNIGYATVTVWLDVEEDTKEENSEETKEKEEDESNDVAFSANQQYGSCNDDKPYDVFWGTATPGSKITISSPHGSAMVEVNHKGHWEKKVYFEGAPIDQTFVVTISGVNGSRNFEFTAESHEAGDGHESGAGESAE